MKKNSRLQKHWEGYLAQVYPNGTGDEQKKQLYRAFYAGCLVMYRETVLSVCDMSDDAAVKFLTELRDELDGIIAEHSKTIDARN